MLGLPHEIQDITLIFHPIHNSPESFVMRVLQQGMQCKQSKHVCQSVKYLK
jgi:hypothetical protein